MADSTGEDEANELMVRRAEGKGQPVRAEYRSGGIQSAHVNT
jgi:hypothetical protein